MDSNDFIRCRKVSGKHHMFCPVKRKKVILGKGQSDGDIAFLSSSQAAQLRDDKEKSWEVLDAGPSAEEILTEQIDEVQGEFVLKERSPGWYDVINTATGNPVNTAALRKSDAEAMLSNQDEPVSDAPPSEGDE